MDTNNCSSGSRWSEGTTTTPRSPLRDRSNTDEAVAAKSLIRGFIDRPDGHKKPPAQSPPLSSGSNRQAPTGTVSPKETLARQADSSSEDRRPVAFVHDRFDRSSGGELGISVDAVVHHHQASSDRRSDGSTSGNPQFHCPTAGSSNGDTTESQHHQQRQHRRGRAAPPPVACTLVAFEPGSLGLELEAIVDDESTPRRRGGEREGRGSAAGPGDRLGCRVFCVTQGGQADLHGNIHPGDALVVLDGADVLSDPFDAITRTLLERRGQRRLIGFMGAAAVAHSTRAVADARAPTQRPSSGAPRGRRREPSSSSSATVAVAGNARSTPDPAKNTTSSAPHVPSTERSLARGKPPGHFVAASASSNGVTAAAAAGATATTASKISHRSENSSRGGMSPRGGERPGGQRRHQDGSTLLVEETRDVRGRESAANAREGERRGGDARRGGEEHTQSKRGRGRTNDADDAAVAGAAFHRRSRRSSVAPGSGDAACRGAAYLDASHTTPADFPADYERRDTSERARSGAISDDAGIYLGERWVGARQRAGSYSASTSVGGDSGDGGGAGRGRSAVRGAFSSAHPGGALGRSWGSAAMTVDRVAGGHGRRHRNRPLERSRGASLQRSLEGAIEEKSALAAERAWLLEELQLAREATLEREGALAGQEVQTDVLKMEINALEVELRRARQELGACEAGRRELTEAAKRDIVRRDRDASDLSDLLRRERAARERDAKAALAAARTAADKAADKATARAAAAGRAAVATAERRAETAEARAAEVEERGAADAAAAREAAVDGEAALRRERERREMEVRERNEEIAALAERLEASESRARKAAGDKEGQLRGLEEAAVKSLEDAERRRSEWEERASALAARLRERDAEGARQARRLKDLESQLRRAHARSVELEEKQASGAHRLARDVEVAERALKDCRVRAQAEVDGVSQRLQEEERKCAATETRLRAVEHRARILETGAAAARQRAESGARKEKDLSERLAEAETERACQEVAVTTLEAQLTQLRQSATAGDVALREGARVRAVLERRWWRRQGMEATTMATKKFLPSSGTPSAPVGGAAGGAGSIAETTVTSCTGVVCDDGGGSDVSGDGGGGDRGRGGGEREEELVALAEAVLRRLERAEEDLGTAREEIKALRERQEDAEELKSVLAEKRGVSTELARRADAARATAELAEAEVSSLRREISSLRVESDAAEKRAEERTKAASELVLRVSALEQALSNARSESAVLAERAAVAEAMAKKARRDVEVATDRLAPLEEALEAAEAEKTDAVRRLTRKDGECVALRSRLEGALAELEAVKVALFQGSDERVSRQRKACVRISAVFTRSLSTSAAKAIALLRWRHATAAIASASASAPATAVGVTIPYTPSAGGSLGGQDTLAHVGGDGGGRDLADGDVQAETAAVAAGAAAVARSEVDASAKKHAEILEDYRSARSELACLHLRTRMCGARVLSGVLDKWAARQSARAFWRLGTTGTSGRGAVPPCDFCGPTSGNDGATRVAGEESALTIHAPTQGGDGDGDGGSGCMSWGSPVGSGGSEWGPQYSARVSGGGGGGRGDLPRSSARHRRHHRDHGYHSAGTATTMLTTALSSPDGSDALTSDAFSHDDSFNGVDAFEPDQAFDRDHAMSSDARALKPGCRSSRRRRERASGRVGHGGGGIRSGGGDSGKHSPPPPSPALSWARSDNTSDNHPEFTKESLGAGLASGGGVGAVRSPTASVATASVATATPGSIAAAKGVSSAGTVGDGVSVGVVVGGVGGSGVGDLSFVSGASSEPRYHCLRPGLASPAWSGASGAEGGGEEDRVMDISEDSAWEGAEQTDAFSRDECGDTGASEGGGEGEVSDREGRGKAIGAVGLGLGISLRVSEGGDSSWWALSDESA